MLDKAISIMAQAFEGRYDKGGKPYALHCIRVMNKVMVRCPNDEELASAAVLHDVVEDTAWTLDKLMQTGFFTARVITTVGLCTHDPAVPYDDYIKFISTNRDATIIKLSDLEDNSDITRIKGLRKKDFDRIEKYNRNYVYLVDIYK